jgi:hypothetical protein
MRFEYKRFDQPQGAPIERPVIPIVLRNLRDPGTSAIAYEALVDSGSDRNIFPAEIGDLLGIDLTSDPIAVRYIAGVVAGVRRPVYFHPIEIEVGGLGGPAFMTTAGFMSDFSKGGYGLLGRKGFFNEFTFVKFKDADHVVEIGKRRR